MLIRRKLIRAKAAELLAQCRIDTPPVNVKVIAKELGIELVLESAEDQLSGFLLRDPTKNKVIIGVNKSHHENRQRFTVAHEIGHFLLHHGEELHVDEAPTGYHVNLRYGSSKEVGIDEREANVFAAELLMPVDLLEKDIECLGTLGVWDDSQLATLATKYRVSVQAITLRLTNLGYLSE